MDVSQEAEELVVNIAQFEPVMPGALIIKSNRGYAILHDLEQQPSGNPRWIDDVLMALLAHCSITGVGRGECCQLYLGCQLLAGPAAPGTHFS